jgi:hypothetical protein
VGPTISFGPEGSSFMVAVAIEVPASEAPDHLLTRPHGSGAWSEVEGAVWVESAGVIMANVTHFSDFVPVVDETPEPDAGTPDGGSCPSAPASEGNCSDGSDRDCDGLVDCDDAADCGDRTWCTTRSCDPAAATDGCAAGQHCALAAPAAHPWVPGAACVADGDGAEGDPCASASDCGPGLSCTAFLAFSGVEGNMYLHASSEGTTGRACRPICATVGDWAQGTCASGQRCHPIVQTDASGGTMSDGSMLWSGYGACDEPLPPGATMP